MRIFTAICVMLTFFLSNSESANAEGAKRDLKDLQPADVATEKPLQQGLQDNAANKSQEDIVFYECRRAIVDACTCREVNEEAIYKKISNLITDKNLLKCLAEIIDDFQEVNFSLMRIFNFTATKSLWDALMQMEVNEKTALEIMKNIKNINFNEVDMKSPVFKVVRRLGCGIHWKDMTKYHCIREIISGVKESQILIPDAKRQDIYVKIVKAVLKRHIDASEIEKTKTGFVQELYKKGIAKKQIEKVFGQIQSPAVKKQVSN